MRTSLLIPCVGLLLAIFASSSCGRNEVASSGSAQVVASSPSPTPSLATELKPILFADLPLEEIANIVKSSDPNDPFALFASALAASRRGDVAAAKKELKRAIAAPHGESRILLFAWKALRELGEHPPKKIANQVQGVVAELHNEAGVGTIAGYADGRARWFGGQGAGTFWEDTAKGTKVNLAIQQLLKAAEPFVGTVSPTDRHKTPEPPMEHFRVSILTFSGIYTVEVYGPEIHDQHRMAPLLTASINLLDALPEKKAP